MDLLFKFDNRRQIMYITIIGYVGNLNLRILTLNLS